MGKDLVSHMGIVNKQRHLHNPSIKIVVHPFNTVPIYLTSNVSAIINLGDIYNIRIFKIKIDYKYMTTTIAKKNWALKKNNPLDGNKAKLQCE